MRLQTEQTAQEIFGCGLARGVLAHDLPCGRIGWKVQALPRFFDLLRKVRLSVILRRHVFRLFSHGAKCSLAGLSGEAAVAASVRNITQRANRG